MVDGLMVYTYNAHTGSPLSRILRGGAAGRADNVYSASFAPLWEDAYTTFLPSVFI